MANNFNSDDIKKDLKNINSGQMSSKYKMNINLDQKSLLDSVDFANTFSFLKPDETCVSEGEWVTFGDTSQDGFKIKEVKPPSLPWDEVNDRPVKGTPILPSYSRGVNCGTGVGNANLDLVFSCNFVGNININSCLFKFKNINEIIIHRELRYIWHKTLEEFPFLDLITKLIELICRIAKMIAKIICFIKQMLICIIDTIKSVMQIIQWIISLPVKFIAFLIQCVTNFIAGILNSIKSIANLISNLTSIFCPTYSCNITSTNIS